MARILVVDDEPSCRTFAALVLQVAGHQTTLAADGLEALEAPGPFDLLLTDLMMPRMMGGELARRMRQGDPAVKVLYLTGDREELFKEKAVLLAGEAFLGKPVSPEMLEETVSLLLSGPVVPLLETAATVPPRRAVVGCVQLELIEPPTRPSGVTSK